jgi:protein-S-isoprenylcysteine O-methyltransferase Ste14
MITRLTIITLEVLVFGSYTWALTSWLRKVKQTSSWELNFIKYGGLIFTIAHITAAVLWPLPSSNQVYFGAAFFFLGMIIFWSAVSVFENPPAVAFAEIIITNLKTTGPYRFVRHPIYTSYILAWLGGSIATNCWWLLISLVCMTFLYNRAAIQEEKQWLSGKDSEEYKNFMKSRGRFLPIIFKNKL